MRRVLAAAVVALCAVTGWAWWGHVQALRDDTTREQMVEAARDAALALTTIDHNRVDADVQRILDSSTGALHDDFAQRAESLKTAARRAQSISVGTVREAGLESVDGDTARVLVALTVMTSNRGAPEREAKLWRTRVSVDRTDGGFKAAGVEFVP